MRAKITASALMTTLTSSSVGVRESKSGSDGFETSSRTANAVRRLSLK